MAIDIGRREFFAALGGATVAWPLATRAHQPAMPVVGFVSTGTSGEDPHLVAAFRRGLSENGFVEGQNVAIEYRWAEGQYDRLPAFAADLVRRRVALLAVLGNTPGRLVATAANVESPLVFYAGVDPVEIGLVSRFSLPGNTVRGIPQIATALEAKRLELLHELIPDAALIALLMVPKFPDNEDMLQSVMEAARRLGLEILIVEANSEREIDAGFATLTNIRALLVASHPLFFSQRNQLVALAARRALPTIYHQRELATAGGLMSYGARLTDMYRLTGIYAGWVLKGNKPAALPEQQFSKAELVINLKTAKTLGLKPPRTLLSRADEVIQIGRSPTASGFSRHHFEHAPGTSACPRHSDLPLHCSEPARCANSGRPACQYFQDGHSE